MVALLAVAGPLLAGLAIWKFREGGESLGGAVMAALSVSVLLGVAVHIQREKGKLPARQQTHEALLQNLATCWARVHDCAIVGSDGDSDGPVTHYILELELGSGHAPDASRPWQVRWRVPAAVAASVVPGAWFAVAYDVRDPDATEALFMQYLVSMSGATLPLK
ncbi:hypothetical protein LXT21_13690 [Myxococcus sp. K38C18041901]|uniref:hypothetical protein n=1 Tax=Myxococcus guangdongensis TaxID=2906760 RepID=UPI0020A76F25|nr:hypothetical protein [Myxococcus guangdongensis]MCP3059832.1 hypothetical protein [Myxococcus guangdongensis]